ncbi:helix-turn-helix domain-containing protein [Clostridium celatum]|uniref:helix-turn-helix domain-containing protein n=1 Tax=Clostridium celatum TaxID=36834 RepID=UPI001A9AD886
MSYKHITINERCCIVKYLNLGWSLSKIAKELNRNKSNISIEFNNGIYKGILEHCSVQLLRRKGKSLKP